MSTARLPRQRHRLQADDQGIGLINVGAAWTMLRQNLRTVDISSSVPVNTDPLRIPGDPGLGPGIYDREGVVSRRSVHAEVHVHAERRAGRRSRTT